MNREKYTATTLHVKAPAKINLFLHVVGQREDGYHQLETWMQKVALYDDIELSITDTPEIQCNCSSIGSNGVTQNTDNLAYKAAALFFSKSERAAGKGVIIDLEKNIPVAAGLGGGSSDAGTVLKVLNTHFDNEFDRETLLEMGLSLGADVPFFTVDDKSVLAKGVGEKLEAAPVCSAYEIILVNPGVELSTEKVFKTFALTKGKQKYIFSRSCTLCRNRFSMDVLRNDLEQTAIFLLPVIGDIKKQLTVAGADIVFMSGSGPTVCGLFKKDQKISGMLQKTACQLRSKYGNNVYLV